MSSIKKPLHTTSDSSPILKMREEESRILHEETIPESQAVVERAKSVMDVRDLSEITISGDWRLMSAKTLLSQIEPFAADGAEEAQSWCSSLLDLIEEMSSWPEKKPTDLYRQRYYKGVDMVFAGVIAYRDRMRKE